MNKSYYVTVLCLLLLQHLIWHIAINSKHLTITVDSLHKHIDWSQTPVTCWLRSAFGVMERNKLVYVLSLPGPGRRSGEAAPGSQSGVQTADWSGVQTRDDPTQPCLHPCSSQCHLLPLLLRPVWARGRTGRVGEEAEDWESSQGMLKQPFCSYFQFWPSTELVCFSDGLTVKAICSNQVISCYCHSLFNSSNQLRQVNAG